LGEQPGDCSGGTVSIGWENSSESKNGNSRPHNCPHERPVISTEDCNNLVKPPRTDSCT